MWLNNVSLGEVASILDVINGDGKEAIIRNNKETITKISYNEKNRTIKIEIISEGDEDYIGYVIAEEEIPTNRIALAIVPAEEIDTFNIYFMERGEK